MKPLEKSGGLVDFKENIIFENEKDTAFASVKQFRYKVYKEYKYRATSSLYRKVVNYQIETYGRTLHERVEGLTKQQCLQTKKHRMQVATNDFFSKQLGSLEKRATKNLKKNMKVNYVIEKDNILDCYIVWEIHRNYRIDRFRANLKKDCKRWIEKERKQ